MKIKVAILGSTGSIGKSLLNLISKDPKKFKIELLTANKNYKKLVNQANKFNVKNIIISNKENYKKAKKQNKNNKIKIYNNYEKLNKILPKKIDYVMSSIVGLDGLKPTFQIIKFTKKIAIANKESIICAWNLIQKELKKHKTVFVPVDSEHFSIWYALKNTSIKSLEKLYLTASGGPLLNVPEKNYNKLKIEQIIKHPNWKMGPKISVDSSTMINKVFEIIEAKKIFKLKYNQLSILIHPKSYIHSIIKYRDGMIKIIAHDTTMEIPIFNTIDNLNFDKLITKELDLNKLNDPQFSKINLKKFPVVNLIKKFPDKDSLYETVLVSINDHLVTKYLKKKITFSNMLFELLDLMSKKEFLKYKYIEPKNIADIFMINKIIKSKINYD